MEKMLAKIPKRGRGRPKLYGAQVLVAMTPRMRDAIDQALEEDEIRLDFIREAIKRELQRRHQR